MDSSISNHCLFPGISYLTDNRTIPSSLLLLMGPAGAGKTMYCRQFIADGLINGDNCIYVSSSLNEKQFRSSFLADNKIQHQNAKLIDPYAQVKWESREPSSNVKVGEKSTDEEKLFATLAKIRSTIIKDATSAETQTHGSVANGCMRLVVDSLTHLSLLFSQSALLKFIHELSITLREVEATALFILTTGDASTDKDMIAKLSSILDGIVEMKLEDTGNSISRSIRLLSVKGLRHEPKWIRFNIADVGNLLFGDQTAKPGTSAIKCTLCRKPIIGSAINYLDFSFDNASCMQTYMKLQNYYGANLLDSGLPVEIADVNFFFMDIVSLSDPSLPVEMQKEKIESLNELVGSCDAFKKTEYKKFSFPTGDGMAIGFLTNPELPLQLSIQLHAKLREHNHDRSVHDQLDVRIGLASGPVFMVNDINSNQNVWGPGIILARRVMDIGDKDHVLIADKLADELIGLKGQYRRVIHLINSDYQIKHGQRIKLYSAYSNEFGNAKIPTRIAPN